jgi:hypothetical protein
MLLMYSPGAVPAGTVTVKLFVLVVFGARRNTSSG